MENLVLLNQKNFLLTHMKQTVTYLENNFCCYTDVHENVVLNTVSLILSIKECINQNS